MILSSLKSKSVGFLTGLIIILLAAFAVGYWAWTESLNYESPKEFSPDSNPTGQAGIMNYDGLSTRPPKASSLETIGDVSNWQTYRNEEYGFEVKYPPANVSEVVENGPDTYELQLREGEQISGTQAPLLESVYFKNKFGEIILAVDIPDNRNLGIVTGDYGWWLRPCGQEGFAEIKSKETLVFAGQKTLRVVSIFEFENPSKEQTYFYCINHPRNPIIISYQKTTFGYIVEPILSTFKFIE